MTGRDIFTSEPVGFGKQRGEFHVAVAEDAGVRRSARGILACKISFDFPAEDVAAIDGRKRNPEKRGAIARALWIGISMHYERRPEDLVSRFSQSKYGITAVKPSAHSEKDFLHFADSAYPCSSACAHALQQPLHVPATSLSMPFLL